MQQQNQQPFHNARTAFGFLSVGCHAYALCLWPFIRRRFGVHAFGLPVLVAFAIIILYASQMRSQVMLVYFWVWLALVALHHAASQRHRRAGHVTHSRFAGLPLFRLPLVRTLDQARAIEPVLLLIIGGLLVGFDQALGQFVIGGAFATAIINGINAQANRMRVIRMHDAMLENEHFAERVRDQR